VTYFLHFRTGQHKAKTMANTKASYSMIDGAPANVLDNGASSDGVQNNQPAVQATFNSVNNVDGSIVSCENNVRIANKFGYSDANVIRHEDLIWPSKAAIWGQGPTWETVLTQNQFSAPYQVLPVVTAPWVGSTAYSLGQKIVNGGNAYYCTSTGTSAASGGPSGTGTGIVDGTCVWKYIVNGLYASVPVNELRVHAPYHPGIVLNNLTPAMYDGVVQPSQQFGLDLAAAGGNDTSRYKSLVFSQDGLGQWQQVSDGYIGDLAFHNISQSKYFRGYFTGLDGDFCIQKTNNDSSSMPLDVAGAMRGGTDFRTDITPIQYDNRVRFPGRFSFKMYYKDDATNNESTIQLEGATGYQVGINAPNIVGVTAAVSLTAGDGSGNARGAVLDGFYNAFSPSVTAITSLGRAGKLWSEVFASTGTINTSDERLKQDIEDLDDAEKLVAQSLKGLIKKFRYKNAVSEKGDAARIHIGVIAQEVISAFEAQGLDAMKYGIVCYDKWEATEDEIDRNGDITKAGETAGDLYSIRYDELFAFIISTL